MAAESQYFGHSNPRFNAEAGMEVIDRWQWLPKLSTGAYSPPPRCSHAAASISETEFVIVGGGVCEPNPNIDETGGDEDIEHTWRHFNDVWKFSTLDASWERLDVPNDTPSRDSPTPLEAGNASNGDTEGLQEDAIKSMSPRRGHVLVYDASCHQLVVFGGTSGSTTNESSLNDVWTFDLGTRRWALQITQGGSAHPPPSHLRQVSADREGLPRPRRGQSGWLARGCFWVFGGYTDHAWGFDPRLWSLDLSTWVWNVQPFGAQHEYMFLSSSESSDEPSCTRRPISDWNGPMLALSPVALTSTPGSLSGEPEAAWFFGGSSPTDPSLSNILFRLDLDTFQWTVYSFDSTDERVSAPPPRFCHGFLSVGARCLVVFGGSGAEQGAISDCVHVLDTQTLQWTTLHAGSPPAIGIQSASVLDVQESAEESMAVHKPSPRNGFSFVRLGNKIVLFGGGVYPTEYYSDTWALDLDLPLVIPKCRPPSWHTLLAQCDMTASEMATNQTLNLGAPDLKLICPALLALVKNSSADSAEAGAVDRASDDAAVTLWAHRSLLAQRCPFFSALAHFAEATQHELALPEAPAPAVRVAINYLYTGILRWKPTKLNGVGSMGEKSRESVGETPASHSIDSNTKIPSVRKPAEVQDLNSVPGDCVNLLSDGLELAQSVLHLAGLWSLDHLKHLVELDILRAFSTPAANGSNNHSENIDSNFSLSTPPEPAERMGIHQRPSDSSMRADAHVIGSSHLINSRERLKVPVEHAAQLLVLADCFQCPLLKEHSLHTLKRHGAVLTEDRIVRLKSPTESEQLESFDQLGDGLAQELRLYLNTLL